MITQLIVVAGVAYLLDAIPSGLLIGRIFYGIDIRRHGSHRTGATNVLRTLGKKAAAAAFAMDAAKGALAMAIARLFLPLEPWGHALAALAVMAGHNWPEFVGFRGGRGVIVSFVAVGVLHFPVFLALAAVGAVVLWRWRFVSLTSMTGCALAPLLFFVSYLRGDVPLAYLVYAALGGAVIIVVHRDNIERLLAGREARLGERVQPTS